MRRRLLGRNRGSGYLLDTYPAAFGVSLRRLKADQTNVLQLRRESDGSFTYLKVDSGSISLNSLVTSGQALGAWAGSSNVFVKKWVDVNGLEVVTQSPTAEPQIIASGVLKTKNGLAAVYFNGNNRIDATVGSIPAMDSGNAFTVYTVSNTTSLNTVYGIFGSTNNGNRFQVFRNNQSNLTSTLIQTASGAYEAKLSVRVDTTDAVLQTSVVSGTDLSVFHNGIAGDQNVPFTGTYVNDAIIIGCQFGARNRLVGNIQEILVFEGAHDTATRQAVEADIMTYYGI